MSWLDSGGFERRPLVFVEDHLYHTGELLDAVALAQPDLVSLLTVCAVDRAGPDTDAALGEWLARHPDLQVAAVSETAHPRLRPIRPRDLESLPSFAAFVAGLLRPDGVLIEDVQLSTLPFVPADRWWESIFVATTVRGLLAGRPPAVRFLSNKRGYAATFGRDLAEAGFDPRDVIDKTEVATVGVAAIRALVARQFDLALEARLPPGAPRHTRVSTGDRADLEATLDLILWPGADGADSADLGGRLVGRRVELRAGSHEVTTWADLLADAFVGGAGLPVTAVGARLGPNGAERAELTNLAARHLHALRARLTDGSAVVTSRHAYRLADHLALGRVGRPDLRRPPR